MAAHVEQPRESAKEIIGLSIPEAVIIKHVLKMQLFVTLFAVIADISLNHHT